MKHPNKLRYFRVRSGLTEKQVAGYLGLKNEITIRRWEKGEAVPKNGYMALQLAVIYKVQLFDLYPVQYRQAEKDVAANARKYGIELKRQPIKKRVVKKAKLKEV